MNDYPTTPDFQAFLNWLARMVRSEAFQKHPAFVTFIRANRARKWLLDGLKGRQN